MPFDMEEHESDEFTNKCLFRDGTEDNFLAIKTKCKSQGVSVGSIGLAASYMAVAIVNAKSCKEGGGVKNQYIDIPVNIRHRIDGLNGYEYTGFYVTEVTLKCDVTEDTKLWDLANSIQVCDSRFLTVFVKEMTIKVLLLETTEWNDQARSAPAVC